MTDRVTCPHCNQAHARGSNALAHARVCLRDPAVAAIVRAALDDGTGRAKTAVAYDASRPQGAPSANGLAAQLHPHGWGGVARHCGLLPVQRGRPRKDGAPPQPHTADRLAAPLPTLAAREERWQRAGLVVARKSYEDDREVRWVLR